MNRTCVRGRGRGRRSERIPVCRLSSWIADRERKRVSGRTSEREDEQGCRLNHHHLHHFTTPFSWHGGVSVGRDAPHCSLFPIPVLHRQTHLSEWFHSSSSVLLSFSCQPPSALLLLFYFLSFSAPLFSFLSSPTHRYPTHFVTAKEKKMIGRRAVRGKKERRYEDSSIRMWSSKPQEAGPLLMDYPERRTRNAWEKRVRWKPEGGGGDDHSCSFITFR